MKRGGMTFYAFCRSRHPFTALAPDAYRLQVLVSYFFVSLDPFSMKYLD